MTEAAGPTALPDGVMAAALSANARSPPGGALFSARGRSLMDSLQTANGMRRMRVEGWDLRVTFGSVAPLGAVALTRMHLGHTYVPCTGAEVGAYVALCAQRLKTLIDTVSEWELRVLGAVSRAAAHSEVDAMPPLDLVVSNVEEPYTYPLLCTTAYHMCPSSRVTGQRIRCSEVVSLDMLRTVARQACSKSNHPHMRPFLLAKFCMSLPVPKTYITQSFFDEAEHVGCCCGAKKRLRIVCSTGPNSSTMNAAASRAASPGDAARGLGCQ